MAGSRYGRYASKREAYAAFVREAERFMAQRGGCLAGYLAFYLPYGRSVENITGIYEADVAYTKQLQGKLASMR